MPAASRGAFTSARVDERLVGPSSTASNRFETQFGTGVSELRQKLLIVAPMSSHHATLLRGAVEASLPFYDVYITGGADSRTRPFGATGSTLTITSIT
jgi:poly-beta-hydroxyalkanoate depolymerase